MRMYEQGYTQSDMKNLTEKQMKTGLTSLTTEAHTKSCNLVNEKAAIP